MSLAARPLRRRASAVWAVAIVILASGAAAVTVGSVAGSPGSLAPVDGSAAALEPFSERVGYAELPLASVHPSGLATGPQPIEITFEPTSSAFFDPPSPNAAPMTTAEVAAVYGLSPSAYSSAEQYFEESGLTVTHAWSDRLSLSLTGSTGAVERAFGVSLLSGSYEGRTVTYPASLPSLPTGLESEISSVSGLSSGFNTFTLPDLPEPTPAQSPAVNPNDLVTPSIARDIYGISGLYNLTTSASTYATGKGIVLLLWGDGYAPNDLSTFFSQFYPGNFPAPTITAYPVDGAPPPSSGAVNDPSNAPRELTLDLEWSGSMAPGADLDAVYAPDGSPSNDYSPTDTGMIDAMNTAIDTSSIPNVAAISMSFGSGDGADTTLQNAFQSDFAVAAQEHISLFAATGDTGGDANASCSGGPAPEYPAASPNVVAVGGTSVSLDRSALGAVTGFSESAWSMSGGGFSTVYSAPSWQEVGSAAAPIEANGHRGMPDVAATAGYNFLYYDGSQDAGGGTSFATPLWAGMVTEMDALRSATIGKPNFGFVTPALYGLGANTSSTFPAFNDVTSGSNCLGPAGPGWDTATGWGSPVGVNLYEHLVASFVNMPLSVSPTPVAPGGTVTITVTVSNSTSGAPIHGVTVALTLSTTGLVGGPCSGTFGSVSPVTNATGVAVATISVPACYLGSSAVANALVSTDGYYGTNSSTVSVNLLGFVPGLSALATYPDNVILFVAIIGLSIVVGGVLGRRRPHPRRVAHPSGSSSPPPPETGMASSSGVEASSAPPPPPASAPVASAAAAGPVSPPAPPVEPSPDPGPAAVEPPPPVSEVPPPELPSS